MVKLMDILAEVGEGTAEKYPWKFQNSRTKRDRIYNKYTFKTDKNTEYFVNLILAPNEINDAVWNMGVAFGIGYGAWKDKIVGDEDPFKKMSNRGEVFRVMATIVDIVKTVIAEEAKKGNKIKVILFKPSKEKETKMGFKQSDQRYKLYKAYLDKNMDQIYNISMNSDGNVEVVLK